MELKPLVKVVSTTGRLEREVVIRGPLCQYWAALDGELFHRKDGCPVKDHFSHIMLEDRLALESHFAEGASHD